VPTYLIRHPKHGTSRVSCDRLTRPTRRRIIGWADGAIVFTAWVPKPTTTKEQP
jgi:hypothetical protein